MVAPLNLEEFYLTATGQTDIFIQYTDKSLTIGKVMVEVYGLMVHLLIRICSSRNLQTLPQKRYVEHIGVSGFASVFQLFVGLFGTVETILFLTEKKIFMSNRLFIRWYTGSSYGISCFLRTNETLWWLDVLVSYWWHRSISPGICGSILVDFCSRPPIICVG